MPENLNEIDSSTIGASLSHSIKSKFKLHQCIQHSYHKNKQAVHIHNICKDLMKRLIAIEAG